MSEWFTPPKFASLDESSPLLYTMAGYLSKIA